MNSPLKFAYTALLALSLVLGTITIAVMPACTTSQQRITYNTLYSLTATVNTTHDAYLDQVVHNRIPTNSVPTVARAYNDYNAALKVAIASAQFNWTNAAPHDLTELGQAVINAITTATKPIK